MDAYLDNVTVTIGDDTTNLIKDGSFETAPNAEPVETWRERFPLLDGWTPKGTGKENVTAITDPDNEDNGVLKILDTTATGYPYVDYNIAIPVEPGSTYRLTAQYKFAEGVINPSLGIYLRHTKSSDMRDEDNKIINRLVSTSYKNTGKTWQPISHEIVIPEGVTVVYLRLATAAIVPS